jgi:hypothetical protein
MRGRNRRVRFREVTIQVVEAKNKTEDVFGNVFIRANPEKEGADKR